MNLGQDVQLERYRLRVGKEQLTAVDIAHEAMVLDKAGRQLTTKVNDFAAHMLGLAALCGSPEEFKVVLRQTRLKMGWGRKKPTPKIFAVYGSEIYRAWLLGVAPHQPATVPLLEHGQPLLDDHGQPRTQVIRVESLNQLKQAARAVRIKPHTERRQPARRLMESIDPVATNRFHRLVQAYVTSPEEKRSQILLGLEQLLAWAEPVSYNS